MNAPFIQPVADQPHGLWSLWDMLTFNASSFYNATISLGALRRLIQEEGAREEGEDSPWKPGAIMDVAGASLGMSKVRELEGSLIALGARMTLISVDRFKNSLTDRDNRITNEQFSDYVEEIELRLRDELSFIRTLVIEEKHHSYFEPTHPHFGQDCQDKFLSASFEIDEAGKCLALGRPTASVFHLMRTMEIAILALSRCMAIPDPVKPVDRNWGKILESVWSGIEARWPTTVSRLSGDGALFESLHASLDAVKNPWRNATMHVENKYTDDEAEHIFVAVKGFMKKLASRCDEEGKPFA
jgi:hypothetical protein